MRLICPNCSAQYEIDATLIPDEGRDVQCSNCGHTWFELPPAPPAFAEDAQEDAPEPSEMEASEAPEPAVEESADDPAPEDSWVEPEEEPEPVHDAEPEPEPEPEVAEAAPEDASEDVSEEEDDTDDGRSAAARAVAEASENAEIDTPEPDPFAAAAAAGQAFERNRATDHTALGILREEAEREIAQRRAPPRTGIETQTDLSLDDVEQSDEPSRALRARMAREEREEAEEKLPETTGASDPRVQSIEQGIDESRRDLLPDIDEINSSLKARKAAAQRAMSEEVDRRRGFRSGFLTMILLTVLLLIAYAWAPAIASAVPSLEGPLTGYVDMANGVRDWLDGLIGR